MLWPAADAKIGLAPSLRTPPFSDATRATRGAAQLLRAAYAIILKSHLFQQIQGIFMPKLKTHKGASKRFKKTGTGKVMRNHAFARHILTSKPHKRKKKLHRNVLADKADQPVLKRMIPY
jgi:large subunit ribosomal protein L35